MNGYNFTERVRWVLATSREEATKLRHEYVGTEHLLLGLVRDDGGVAAEVLRNLDVDPDEVSSVVLEIVQPGHADGGRAEALPYTSRAKKAIELAMDEARQLNHSYVGTEHLLLGLLREEKGIAAQVLSDHGLTVDSTRTEMMRLLAEGIPRSEVPPPRDHASAFPGSSPISASGQFRAVRAVDPLDVRLKRAQGEALTAQIAHERADTMRIEEDVTWARLAHALDLADRLKVEPAIDVVAGGLVVTLPGVLSMQLRFPADVHFAAPE